MPRCIFHLDLDVFFVAVERLLNPSLAGRPVIVSAGTARSVVAAASYEARKFGVHSAQPYAQAKRLCPQAVVCPGNFEAYGKYSRAFFKILDRISPDLEPMSMDEAYLDYTSCTALFGPPLPAATDLQQRVHQELGLDVSIGIAPSKLVAKIASDSAKPAGILQILPGHEAAFLSPLPVGRLLGVGPKTGAEFKRLGIATIGTLARMPRADLEKLLGEDAAGWQAWARGEDPSRVQARGSAKSIGREETFLTDRTQRAELQDVLRELASDVAYQLRAQNRWARTVCLKIRHADFSLHTYSKTLGKPTHWDRDLFTAARELLEKALKPPVSIRLLGITAQNLAEAQGQLDLLDPNQENRLEHLHTAADRLREKYGYESVAWASRLRKD